MSNFCRAVGLESLREDFCWVYEKYVSQATEEIQASYREGSASRTGSKSGAMARR